MPSVAAKGSDAVFCGPWRRKRQPAAEDSIRPGPGKTQDKTRKKMKIKREDRKGKGNNGKTVDKQKNIYLFPVFLFPFASAYSLYI